MRASAGCSWPKDIAEAKAKFGHSESISCAFIGPRTGVGAGRKDLEPFGVALGKPLTRGETKGGSCAQESCIRTSLQTTATSLRSWS